MDFKDFTAGPDDEGRRLDKVIRKLIPQNALSGLYSSIRKGLIKLNGKKTDGASKVKAGDVISVAKFLISQGEFYQNAPAAQNDAASQDALVTREAGGPAESASRAANPAPAKNQIHFETIFNNKHIRVINKPYNVNVHGDAQSLDAAVKAVYKTEMHESSLSFEPGPLHRLDKKTTGLLCFSNSHQGALWLTDAIAKKTVRKFYVGIVEGHLENKEVWQDCIEQDTLNKGTFYVMKVVSSKTGGSFASIASQSAPSIGENPSSDAAGSDAAVTICTPLSYGSFRTKKVTLCQFEIITGKKHQIRCQSAYHGHALLGDTAYGSSKINAGQDLFLHAARLIFPDDNPVGLPHELNAALPSNFTKFMNLSLIKWDGSLIIN